jgi:hypothetical protein
MAIDPHSLYERIVAAHAAGAGQDVRLKNGDRSIHASFYGMEAPQTVQVHMPRATLERPTLLHILGMYGGDHKVSLFVNERGNRESGFLLERTLFGNTESTKCAYKIGAECWKMTPPMRQAFADTLHNLGINTDPASFSDVTRCVQQPWTEYHPGLDVLLKLYDGLCARPNLSAVLKLESPGRSAASLGSGMLLVALLARRNSSGNTRDPHKEGFRWLVYDLEQKGVDFSGDWTPQ